MTTSTSAQPTPFDSLSRADQRVAIARDVLERLDAQSLQPTTGDFILARVGDAKTLRELAAKPCQVCALGALLIAQTDVNGDCALADFDSCESRGGDATRLFPYVAPMSHDFVPFITRYFAPDQLQLIEIAFECGRGSFGVVDGWRGHFLDDDDWQQRVLSHGLRITRAQGAAALAFGVSRPDIGQRLRAIMQSIIDNAGTFAP